MYGLKQVPRAWYDRLSNFLLKNDFKRGQVDTTLFKKTLEKDILIVQIYVDDIIFGSTNVYKLIQHFLRRLFLGIQINQCKDGVYVHQSTYTKELLKKFKLEECKEMNTPMHPTCTLSK